MTGAYSTGKTSLAAKLAEALSADGFAVALLPDVGRTCPLPLNNNQTDDASLWLLATQVSREIASQSSDVDLLICDRGIPDVLAHHEEVRARSSAGRVELLQPFLREWLKTYDLILFSRVDQAIPIEADDLRNEDPDYRTLLDGYAARVLTGVPNVFELPIGAAERLTYAREAATRWLSRSSLASRSST